MAFPADPVRIRGEELMAEPPLAGATGCPEGMNCDGTIKESHLAFRDHDGQVITISIDELRTSLYSASWRLGHSDIPETERALMRLAWNAGWAIEQLTHRLREKESPSEAHLSG